MSGGSLRFTSGEPEVDSPTQLVSSFASLNVSPNPPEPDVDTCLAHLKLLFAIQTLKDEVGNHDGLFGIYDGRCTDTRRVKTQGGSEESRTEAASPQKIREKRWALFVARAADRFETWWETAVSGLEDDVKGLSEADLVEGSFVSFPSTGKMIPWEMGDLPPLGGFQDSNG